MTMMTMTLAVMGLAMLVLVVVVVVATVAAARDVEWVTAREKENLGDGGGAFVPPTTMTFESQVWTILR